MASKVEVKASIKEKTPYTGGELVKISQTWEAPGLNPQLAAGRANLRVPELKESNENHNKPFLWTFRRGFVAGSALSGGTFSRRLVD